MRALLASLLAALTIAGPLPALAQQRAGGMSPIIASMGPRGVEIARLHSGSYALAAPVILGGFSSGSGSVLSSGMPDPYTPTDGTWNVTGNITTSARVYAGGATGATLGDAGGGATSARMVSYATEGNTGLNGTGSTTTTILHVMGGAGDSASSTAVRIQAHADYTTSGAKIASFGDNAGAAYAEKASIDLNGAMALAGDLSSTDTQFAITKGASAALLLDDSTGTTLQYGTSSKITIDASRIIMTPGANGGVRFNTSGTKETCAAGIRGSLFYEAGGAGVKDTVFICSKQAAGDTYAWRDIAAPIP